MKKLLFTFLFIFTLTLLSNAQGFDSTLAKSLNADEYGMKKYVLVILKTGSVDITDKTVLDSLFAGHMNTIKKFGEDGSLAVAGPISKNDNNYRGIFIFNVETIEEAKLLVEQDPTVNAGIFDVEMYSWYGSAAMKLIPEIHKLIQKKSF
jgi:uncharacterized protein YciI